MPATAVEQMILELINRARLDPAAEAARDGIDLNEGLAPGTISAASKQPLAMNETLLTIARAHDQDMITHDYFGHTDFLGRTPFQRMSDAGYAYSYAGENIAYDGTSGAVTDAMTIDLERLLFVDSGVGGRGHRVNLLNANYQEVGDGAQDGAFMGFNSTLITQDFAEPSGPATQFLSGVSYDDADHDGFYSLGEGRNGVSVGIAGAASTATAGAGGYSLHVGAGTQDVTFSGGGLASPVSVAVTIVAGTSAKVDMVDQGTVTTSASLTDLGGVTRIIGLGTIGLTLTGDAGAQTFSGTKGDDTIVGGGGADAMLFSGLKSAYSITKLAGGAVRVAGPEGTDTLSGVRRLVFADQTVSLATPPADDLDGNGYSDILWRSTSGDTEAWLTNPSGGYGYANDGSAATDWQVAGTGDLNGDGKADIVWRNATSGDAYLYQSTNAGGYGYFDLGVAPTSWQVAGVGDFNGDGLADIFWRNADGADEIWQTKSSGGFNYVDAGAASTNWKVAGTGDLDGDGETDVVWRDTAGDTEAWYAKSTGGYDYASLGNVSTAWQVAGLGDLNGDGKADIVWRNTSGDAYLYQSNGSGGFGYFDLGVVSTAWQIAHIGDFNGDGLSDILWRNGSTGDNELWQTKAGGGFTYSSVGNVGTNWTIAA